MYSIDLLTDAAIVMSGLMAGFYLAWALSVLPGLTLLGNEDYLRAFQQMNRAILNVPFKTLFFLTFLLGPIAATRHVWLHGLDASWLLVIAATLLAAGHGAVTVFGNIPINVSLDRLDLDHASGDTMADHRVAFETRWRTYHWVRTFATGLAFVLLLCVRLVPVG